jgi:hypothetical protein
MPSASVRPPAVDAVDALPRLGIRDPDFWLAVLSWGVINLSCLQILLFAFGRDQGIYAVVADGLFSGHLPYRDLWDFKPPGIFFVYGLSQLLFGKSMVAPRLLEVAGLIGLVLTFVRLSSIYLGTTRPGLFGGAIAALIHAQLEFWHTGQPETFGGFLTAYAILLTVIDVGPRKRWWAWASAGVLFGIAFMLKPPLGGGALACAAYACARFKPGEEVKPAKLLPAVVIAAGSLLPLLVCWAWFKVSDIWPAFRWTMFEFTPGYTALGWSDRGAGEMFYLALEETFFRSSALAAIGVIAAVTIRPMHSRERELLFLLLGIISVHVAGIAMQGKFFQYHYGATLPLVSLIAGIGMYKLWRRCLMAGTGGVLAFLSFLVVAASMRTAVRDVPGSFWSRSILRTKYALGMTGSSPREMLDRELYYVADYNLDADRRVATELRHRTAPGEPIYVWGFEPAIYWLSERTPSSRFIYNVPQRVVWQRQTARRELMSDLAKHPPAAIVVQSRDVFPMVTGDHVDSADALPAFPELATLVETRYEKATSIEDFDVYTLRTQKPQRSPAP